MAFGYRYTLERQENGWWLVRFPGIAEALTEGETREEARANARDCVIAAQRPQLPHRGHVLSSD
jgi:hypothetical protein